MKLIIQIPAFNEEATIGATIADLPKRIDGVDQIEVIVIDDGSSDGTVAAATKAGASRVIRLLNHRGLATAFAAGIDAALHLDADIIVNTDADHQYRGSDIPALIAPILNGTADVVIGDRNVSASPYMSPLKKMLQRVGSGAVALASGLNVSDATSGLRAFSREAAFQINIFNPFTYTLETIIQAGTRNLELRSVPIGTNAPTRPSRLYRGIGSYVRKSAVTMFRVYTLYKPLKTFFFFGCISLLGGLLLGSRFLYLFLEGHGGGHLQSLILTAVLLIAGFQTILIGLVADLISVNRRLSEEVLIRVRKLEGARPRPSQGRRVVTQTSQRQHPRPATQQQPKPAAERGAQPDTQWVWLLDEKKLNERNERPAAAAAATPVSPAPAAAKPAGRRRRRRRGGFPQQPGSRERKHHPHHDGEQPPVDTPPNDE